jgi:hypothetical protein
MKAIILACCCALTLAHPLAASPDGAVSNYVAHEWGTFTSVQGADGVQMQWNPSNPVELPNFVYSLLRPGLGRSNSVLSVSKSALVTRQRMETPVIYFYSDQPVRVNVAVDFPQGKITEWYPQARFAEELAGNRAMGAGGTPPPSKNNTLRWNDLMIAPSAINRGAQEPTVLPTEPHGSHYYAARETDAVPVAAENGTSSREYEKFLFYRGVGNFIAPLTVKSSDPAGGTLLLANSSDAELRHLFAYEVRAGEVRFAFTARLGARGQTTVRLAYAAPMRLNEARARIGAQLREALAAEGLFPREASAMVKTWDDSWLAEEGVRVLYVLPRAWTDQILPLRMTPSPRAVERVMVGRAEVITPRMESTLAAEVERFAAGGDADRALAIARTRELGLGRFAQPALRRILDSQNRSDEFKQASGQLLAAAGNPAPRSPASAK